MKKLIALILCLLAVLCVFTGCYGETDTFDFSEVKSLYEPPEWQAEVYPQYLCFNNQNQAIYIKNDRETQPENFFFNEVLTIYQKSYRTEYIDCTEYENYDISFLPSEIFEDKTNLKDEHIWSEKGISSPYIRYYGMKAKKEENMPYYTLPSFIITPSDKNENDILFIVEDYNDGWLTFAVHGYRKWFDAVLEFSKQYESFPSLENQFEFQRYAYAAGFQSDEKAYRHTSVRDSDGGLLLPRLYFYIPLLLQKAETEGIAPVKLRGKVETAISESEQVEFDAKRESCGMWFREIESEFCWYRLYNRKNSPKGDVIFYSSDDGNLYLAFQNAKKRSEWISYRFEGYGKWLQSEITPEIPF